MLSRTLSSVLGQRSPYVHHVHSYLCYRSFVSQALPSVSTTAAQQVVGKRKTLFRGRQGQPIPLHVSDLQGNQQLSSHTCAKSSLLPSSSVKSSFESDLVVVLDMDECLIHSSFADSATSSYAHQLLQKQQHNSSFNKTHNQAKVDTMKITLPDSLVTVHLRPGVLDFLDFCTSHFETHIFTAALPVYANPVLDRLDPDSKLSGRWFRDSCRFHAGVYSKRLENLPLEKGDLSRVILVDNNPFSFIDNPDNGILVKSFYDDATDGTLEAVRDVLEELDRVGDVRPVLRRKFGLARALKDYRQDTQPQPSSSSKASQWNSPANWQLSRAA